MAINSLLFEDVCEVMKNMSNEKVAKEKEKILVTYLQEVKINATQSGDKKDSNLFPLIRLFLPDFERERSYNIKEYRLGQILQKLLAIPKNSGDGRKLLEFRSVPNSKIGSDFPSVAFYVLKNRINNTIGSLTIEEINNTLDKIAFAEAGNKAPIDESFNYILRNTTPVQQTWFLRILLKDLKLGIGKTKILAALHPDAPEYYESCSSLQKVCEEVDEGDTRPLELGIRIFSAISPMLSERFDVTNLDKLFSGNVTYQLETKFDGERFQMHMKDNTFEYFSRKGFKYSEHYGKSYDSVGLLTPDLKDCFSPGVVSLILDGEMMGWHKQYECFGSKGMAFDIKKATSTSKFRPCFCAFDVLYYNGTTLVGPNDKGGVPLKERMVILDSIFKERKGIIQKSQRKSVKDKSEVLEALNKAISEQQEGLILKDINSMYIPNRRNVGWYKIKPEYTEGAMVDLDLVIIGADYAENKKQGLAKSFLVACADCSPGEPAHRWVLVGRAATGLSFEERERLCSVLQSQWKRTKYEPPPDCLCFNKEKPDLWILPEHSVVLTVRATELIRSTDFGTSHTLRFPRITHIREDKPVQDILTLDGFNRLVQDKGSVVKLSTTQISEDQLCVASKPPRKRKATPLVIAEVFRHQPSNVEEISQALKGRKICILSDNEDCKKDVLERLVVSHGGVVVQNTASDTWCCIAGRPTIRLKNAIDSKLNDILPTSWLRSLQPSIELIPRPSPINMIAVSRVTQVEMARLYDEFGDSYTEDADEESLRRCFEKMDKEPGSKIYLTTEEIIELEKELYPEGNPYSFLRNMVS